MGAHEIDRSGPERDGGGRAELDRRRAERDEVAVDVELVLASATLAGTTADLSDVGTLMTLEQPLELELRCGGRRWRARLVRCQPVAQGRSALALEFVEPLPDAEPPARA